MNKKRNPRKTNTWGPNNARAAYHFSDLLHEKGKREGKRLRKLEEQQSFEKAKAVLQKNKNAREKMMGAGTNKPFHDQKRYKNPHIRTKVKNKNPVNNISSHAVEHARTGNTTGHKLVNEKERNSSWGFYENKKTFKQRNKEWRERTQRPTGTSAPKPAPQPKPAPSKKNKGIKL